MRYQALIAVALLPLLVFAQDKVKLEPKFEKGAKSKYKFEFKFILSSIEANVTGGFTNEVAETSDSATKLKYDYSDVKLSVDGQEQTVPIEVTNASLDKDRNLTKIEGGIQGGDQARMFLAMHFIPPTKELAKDDTWQLSFPKNTAVDLGKLTFDGKYLGPEKLGDAFAQKFEWKMKEDGNSFTVNNTVWTDAKGNVLKIEGKFENMPVPAAGDSANGSHKIELVK